MEHYKRSLMLAYTAEAWRKCGILAYRLASRLRSGPVSDDVELERRRQALLQDALKYLTEANLLDATCPVINAWLAICSVETGQERVAKQSLRQVMRYEEYLDFGTALKLASVLLRFSDEAQAGPGERPKLVLHGRYAKEAIVFVQMALAREESGEALSVLGQAHMLAGDFNAAMQPLLSAIPMLDGDEALQDLTAAAARTCAAQLLDQPHCALHVEQAINAVMDQRAERAAAAQAAAEAAEAERLAAEQAEAERLAAEQAEAERLAAEAAAEEAPPE